MAKFLNNIDMVGNELQNVVLQPLAGAPASQVKIGRKYFDSADGREKIYNGTKWKVSAYLEDLENLTPEGFEQLGEDFEQLRSDFDALNKALTEDDTQGIINTWNEIQSLVSKLPEGSDLSVLLSNINASVDQLINSSPYVLGFSAYDVIDAIEDKRDFVAPIEGLVDALNSGRTLYIKEHSTLTSLIPVGYTLDGTEILTIEFTFRRILYSVDINTSDGEATPMQVDPSISVTTNYTATNGIEIATITANGKQKKIYSPDPAKDTKTVKKYRGSIRGDGSTSRFTVSHGLNQPYVQVSIFEESDYGFSQIFADVEIITNVTIWVSFATPPANGVTYQVLVIG